MAAEFLRVKNLTSKAGYWVETNRPNDCLYLDDPISMLKGVGKVMSKKLLDSNFKTLSDLKGIDDPNSVEITSVPKSKFKNIWTLAQACQDVNSPPPIDHRKADNPYYSKFGDQWETQLRKSSAFSHCVVITEYIEFMMQQSAHVMKNTKHEDDWVIYHDSLSIMTSVKTKEWMESKGYLKRWILPSKDLYSGDLELKKTLLRQSFGKQS